jgi:hypothetical protein
VKPSLWLSFGVAVAGLAACGDPDSLGGGRDSLAAGAGGAAGSGGSAGGGTSGASGSAGNAGGAGATDAGLRDEVTLTLGPFFVESGREAFMCQTFANPFSGNDVHIREFESHMTRGAHHFLMNVVDDAPTGLEPCTAIDVPSGPYATQTPDDVFTYPEGVAALLAGANNLKLTSHYANSSGTPLLAEVAVTLRRARPETVGQEASFRSLSAPDINVPPRGSQTVGGEITLNAQDEWNVYWVIPHMHQRGTRFTVSAGPRAQQLVYETDRWEAPSRKFDPPLRLSAGDSLNYTCTFFNDTAEPLTFGESPLGNEMCVLVFHHTVVRRP